MTLVRFPAALVTALLVSLIAIAPGFSAADARAGTTSITPLGPGGPFHGSWSGTATLTDRCQNGITYTQTVRASLNLVQNGTALSGQVAFIDLMNIGDRDCSLKGRYNFLAPIAGTASGSSFTVSVTSEGQSATLTGNLSGSSLNGSLSAETTSGTFSLTRDTSESGPGLTGNWRGTYNYKTSSCPGLVKNGPFEASLFQNGEQVFVTLTLRDMYSGNCGSGGTKTEQLGFNARLSGNVVSGTWVENQVDGDARISFSASVSGPSLQGTLSVSHPLRTEELTFSSSNEAASPSIQSFSATPSQVRPGEPVVLLWSTLNASSVTIDPGVGVQPASGSVRVTPNVRTTYQLTASSASGSATASVIVDVVSAPSVSVSAFPNGMLQLAGSSGATDRYVLVNNGGAATTITVGQYGNFFSQSPSSFTLAPGASQEVVITALPVAPGSYEGASTPSGVGVPNGLSIPIRLLVGTPPVGTTVAEPASNRVDALGPARATSSGTATFRNRGTAAIQALVVSDALWLIPQSAPVTIPPNGSAEVRFELEPSRRPDGSDPAGTVMANLTLRFLSGSGSSKAMTPNSGAPAGSSSVGVTYTISLVTAITEPPPLAPGEVALFLPGMGHVTGSVGVFVSDLTLLNRSKTAPIVDAKMFFSPLSGGSSLSASIGQLSANRAVGYADVVKTIFGFDAANGSMQLRSRDALKLAVAANVFNSSNPKGTYGTVIPAFRSDRGVPAGDRLFLTGLRADSNSHTNLYIQETAGLPATVRIDFLDTGGAALGTRTETLGPFKLLQLGNAAPVGAVSAVMTNDVASQGRFLAYATPVDRSSGDTWAVGDWARLGAFSPAEPVVIPVAGSAPGANNSFFRTDLAIMNSGPTAATGTLRYVGRGGETADRTVALGPNSSTILVDVVAAHFNISNPTVGYIVFTPANGNFAVNSRTYTTTQGQSATFGTSIPAIPLASSMRAGQMRQFGGIEDAALGTIQAARPGTFRTNFGMVETSGQPVTVRVTLHYTYSAPGTLAAARASASKEYNLAPRQFLQLSRLSAELIGSSRDASFGDMRDLQADFEVLSGSGTVMVFISSVDNGTADSTTRTE